MLAESRFFFCCLQRPDVSVRVAYFSYVANENILASLSMMLHGDVMFEKSESGPFTVVTDIFSLA